MYDNLRNLENNFPNQWRIQDFPRGAQTPKVGVLTFFCRKLHENERIRTPLDPPMIIYALFAVVKICCVIYICSFIYELLEWSLPITLNTIYFKYMILILSGFYTPAEFEKYMRYLEGPRKRQYESGDNTQAASSPRREPTSPVLLKRRRAKQASETGIQYLSDENNTYHTSGTCNIRILVNST